MTELHEQAAEGVAWTPDDFVAVLRAYLDRFGEAAFVPFRAGDEGRSQR